MRSSCQRYTHGERQTAQSLRKAFRESAQRRIARMRGITAIPDLMPWYLPAIEEMRAALGRTSGEGAHGEL